MPEVAEFIQCDRRNYTPGRQGRRVRYVVVHYTGTDASAHNNLLYFSRTPAGASAHYFIDRDGALRQSVKECDTAWHAGSWTVNLASVGIECVSAGEDFTEAQITTLRALVLDLMARHKVPAEKVIRHYDVTRKRCPAPYVDRAKWKALHARITGGAAPEPAKGGGKAGPSDDVDALARRVLAGEFGNGEQRRKALGSKYAAVQARVNELLGRGGGRDLGTGTDALARAVIRGEYGDGEERRRRLGPDYERVQRRVNELLG